MVSRLEVRLRRRSDLQIAPARSKRDWATPLTALAKILGMEIGVWRFHRFLGNWETGKLTTVATSSADTRACTSSLEFVRINSRSLHSTSRRFLWTSPSRPAVNMTMAMPQGNAVFPRSHVGFDSITQQIEKKLLKRGFQFNVICVGMSTADTMLRTLLT